MHPLQDSRSAELFPLDGNFAFRRVKRDASLWKSVLRVPVNGLVVPQKVEGITVLNGKTVAIANDNDFGVGSFTR